MLHQAECVSLQGSAAALQHRSCRILINYLGACGLEHQTGQQKLFLPQTGGKGSQQ